MYYDRWAAVAAIAAAVAAVVAMMNRWIVSMTFDRAAIDHVTD